MTKTVSSIFWVFAFSLCRGQNSIIQGIITNASDDQRLQGVYITLFPTNQHSFSNARGEFIFENIPQGEFVLKFRLLGYKEHTIIDSLKRAQPHYYRVQLTEQLSELPELTVMTHGGNPIKNTPGSVHLITTRELQKFNYTDMHRCLRNIPGIQMMEEDGFGLRPNIGMRGTSVERSSKITVMEDGVLAAPAPYAEPAAYYFPTLGRMSAVEVLKGSSQIKYGPHTTGGAINLISQHIPDRLYASFQLLGGSHGNRNIHTLIGNTKGRLGYLVEYFNYRSDGFKKLDNGGNTGFEKSDILVKIQYKLRDHRDKFQQSIGLKWAIMHENSNETYLGLSRQDFRSNPFRRYAVSQNDRMAGAHRQWSLTYRIHPSNYMRIELCGYRNDFSRNWYRIDRLKDSSGAKISISEILFNPDKHTNSYQILTNRYHSPLYEIILKANNRTYYAHGIQLLTAYQLNTGNVHHHFTFGLRWHQDASDRFQAEDSYFIAQDALKLKELGIKGTESNRINRANAWAAFIQYNLIYKNWRLYPGLRFESIDLKQSDYGKSDPTRSGHSLVTMRNKTSSIIPGMGLDYQWNKHFNTFIGIHKGFGPPSPNPKTTAEKSINYEMGIRHNTQYIATQLVMFYNDYSNLLGSDLAATGGTGTGDLFNAGAIRSYGIECDWRTNILQIWAIRDWRLPLQLTYTFTDAVFRSSFKSALDVWGTIEKGYHLPYFANHQFTIDAGIEHNKIELHVNARFVDDMLMIAGHKKTAGLHRTDQYLIMDASFHYLIHHPIRLFASIFNLANETYIVSNRPAGLRPGMPRAVMLGLKSNF